MTTITLKEAQTTLAELIHRLTPGEEVVITENDRPVARLVSQLSTAKPALRPPPGLGKGCITILLDDDEHLLDFAEYMSRPFRPIAGGASIGRRHPAR